MKHGLQVTLNVLRVVHLFGGDQSRKLWCYAVAKDLNISRTKADELLRRLESSGWLVSEWERVDVAMAGRPRRRLYRITPKGISEQRKAVVQIKLLV